MTREEWVLNLNNFKVDFNGLREIYIASENNLGPQIFDQCFNIFLQTNTDIVLGFILRKYSIFVLLDKEGVLIKYY